MTKTDFKISDKPTKTILVKVWTSEDDYASVEFAFLNISDEFKSLVKSASEEVKNLKQKFNNSTHCIQIWNYLPFFINSDVAWVLFGDDFNDSFEDFVYVDIPKDQNISDLVYEVCDAEKLETISQDATRLVVTDDSFYFSSYIKHTNIKLDTNTIFISELDK